MFEIIPRPNEMLTKEGSTKLPFGFSNINKYTLDKKYSKKSKDFTIKLLLQISTIFKTRFVREELLSEKEINMGTALYFEMSDDLEGDQYEVSFQQERLINQGKIQIKANTKIAITNALATIFQIFLQNEFFVDGFVIKDGGKKSKKWMGTMIDIARHFYGVPELKKVILIQWLYKQNVLHLHLTDDTGWRIELDSYPEILERASFRFNKMSGCKTYGGFLTKQEIKHLVEFAEIFGVDIVPEIDLPGHLQPVVYTMPDLICDGYKPDPVWYKNGISRDVLCLSNPKSFEVLKNILDEVADLFPSKYIHVGGDEVPHEHWENCSKCQKFMKEKEYESASVMKQKFMIEIIKFLREEKNKKVICWDDIVRNKELNDVTIMYWQTHGSKFYDEKFDLDGIIENGNPIIFGPKSHTYLNYNASARQSINTGIVGEKVITLEHTYSLDFLSFLKNPNNKKAIVGSQVFLWTNQIETFDDLTEKLLPRMIAFQENMWETKTSYNDFIKRLKSNIRIMDYFKISYTNFDFE